MIISKDKYKKYSDDVNYCFIQYLKYFTITFKKKKIFNFFISIDYEKFHYYWLYGLNKPNKKFCIFYELIIILYI